MPMLRVLAVLLLFAAPALAEDDDAPVRLDFGGDVYAVGAEPDLTGAGGSVFAAGSRLRLDTETGGAAHLAGRRVSVAAAVGGPLYAVGYEVDVTAPVAGDASLAGYDVRVEAPVGGVLRAFGSEVRVTAPAAAILGAAERFHLDAAVAGDVRILAETVTFGPNARVGGVLTVLDRRGQAPPPGVAPADRVERLEPWEGRDRPDAFALIVGGLAALLGTAAALLVVQAIFVGAAPQWSEDLAFDVAERPFRSLGIGFLTLSALLGAVPLLVVTVIGAPVAVAVLAAIPLALLAGYALGAWALGTAIWRALDRPPPLGFWLRLGIGAIGLAAAALLGLIPLAGWLIGLAVTLGGIGAAAARLPGRRAAPPLNP